MLVKIFILFLTTGFALFFAPYTNAASYVRVSVLGNGSTESRVSVQSSQSSEMRTFTVGNNTLTIQTSTKNKDQSIDWEARAKQSFVELANEINKEDAQINSWIRAWLEKRNFSRKTFWIFMRGSEEISGQTDTDGYGIARIKVNTDNNEVCIRMKVFDIQTATAAHIHSGNVGEAGQTMVLLPTPDNNGNARGCVLVGDSLAKALLTTPSGYFVQIHNQDFPNGAIKGQLR